MSHIKKTVFFLAAMLVAAGPVGAESGSEPDEQGSMRKQWNETLESLQSYTAQQRDKALQAGKKTLDAMDKRIERMEAWTSENWDSLSAEAREKRTELLESMRKQRNEVAEWYGGMKHGSAAAWERVKNGFIQSYGKLNRAYQAAAESLGSEESTEAQEEPSESAAD